MSNAAPLVVNGVMHSNNKVAVQADMPIQYHLRKLSVRSATGPHKKRQRLAEIPMATMAAASATEKPL